MEEYRFYSFFYYFLKITFRSSKKVSLKIEAAQTQGIFFISAVSGGEKERFPYNYPNKFDKFAQFHPVSKEFILRILVFDSIKYLYLPMLSAEIGIFHCTLKLFAFLVKRWTSPWLHHFPEGALH